MISINVQLIRSYKIDDHKKYITIKADYKIYVGIFKILKITNQGISLKVGNKGVDLVS